MVYSAPKIDAAGLHLSSYQDCEDRLVAAAKKIYGQDIYLENDTQDFQLITVFAQAQYDAQLGVQLAYNSRSVASAIGATLDGLIANNGLSRFGKTKSLVTVVCVGEPFTVISNGAASDTSGNAWILPANVTIGSDGTVAVTAMALADGAITAAASTITQIQTPTFGWVSVTNPNAASPGQDTESDAQVKSRQADSTQAATQTIVGGILSAVRDLPLVTAAQIYENNTGAPLTLINGATNPAGFPKNSTTLVVSGGDDTAIAAAYGVRKSPGSFTNGTTTVNYTDIAGVVTPISFVRPTDSPLDVTVTYKPLAGYSDSVRNAGKQAIADYINSQPSGSTQILSEIQQALSISDTKNTMSIKSITIGHHGSSPSNDDLALNFDQNPTSDVANITWVSLT